MKRLLILLVCFGSVKFSYCQTYQLSNTFGTNGVVETEDITEPRKTIITPDNKILTIGFSLLESPNPDLITHSFLVKLNQDGTTDDTFGNNGITITNVDFKDIPSDVVFQGNNKILLGGQYTLQNPSEGIFPNSPFVIRYNNDGSLDSSFGNNGILKITNFNSITSTDLCSVISLNDESIIIGITGSNSTNFFGALMKLTSSGEIDTSFGTDGVLNLSDSNFKFKLWKLQLTNDNKLILCGYDRTNTSNSKTAVLKLNLDGSFDTTFANNGKLLTDVTTSNGEFEYLNKINISPDGNFICSGRAGSNFLMIKFNSIGQLDQLFANDGIFRDFINIVDVEIDTNGKIFLGGIELQNNGPHFRIINLNENGSINTDFNNNGFLVLDVTSQNDNLKDIAIDNDSSIIISGYSGMVGNYNVTHAKIELENLNVITFEDNQNQLFPNPFNQELNLKYPETIKSISFYDALGKKINSSFVYNSTVINTEFLKDGFYFCLITFINDSTEMIKLFKRSK